MAAKSKRKGKVGELEWAAKCREYGFEARRGQQYSGASGDPDVVTDVPHVHFEVKRTERLNLWSAFDQAKADCGKNLFPVVAHRPNRRDWIVVMSADDFLRIMAEIKFYGG